MGIKLLFVDGSETAFDKKYIKYTRTIKNVAESLGVEGVVPVSINREEWDIFVEYIDVYIEELPMDAQAELEDKSTDEILRLMQVANFLDCEECISGCKDLLISRIKDLKPMEIRVLFSTQQFLEDNNKSEEELKTISDKKTAWYDENILEV